MRSSVRKREREREREREIERERAFLSQLTTFRGGKFASTPDWSRRIVIAFPDLSAFRESVFKILSDQLEK
jgi:hypothetical protein